jgi:hypothetical protein
MYRTGALGEDVFSILSNQRRRYAVRACQQLDAPFELGELAEYVAAEECGKPLSEVTSEERRRVYTSLQQVHIEKLEDAGVIECERKTIEPTERLEELEFYLEVVPGGEIPWAEYYLGLSGVAAALVASAWFGVYPDALTGYVWASLVVALFAVSAGVHYFQTKRNRLGSGVVGDE